MRIKIIAPSEADDLLERTVAEMMQDLRPDFAAARLTLERQVAYQALGRELVADLAQRLAQAELELHLPEHLDEATATEIVNAAVNCIGLMYMELSSSALESFKKTARLGLTPESAPH